MRCTLPILVHDSLNTSDSLSIKLSHWEHVSGAGYGESRDLNTTVVLHVRDRRRACNDPIEGNIPEMQYQPILSLGVPTRTR